MLVSTAQAAEVPKLNRKLRLADEELGRCRRFGNGGPQTCLPAAYGVAQSVAQYGPLH